jgi:hypothetical protein
VLSSLVQTTNSFFRDKREARWALLKSEKRKEREGIFLAVVKKIVRKLSINSYSQILNGADTTAEFNIQTVRRKEVGASPLLCVCLTRPHARRLREFFDLAYKPLCTPTSLCRNRYRKVVENLKKDLNQYKK